MKVAFWESHRRECGLTDPMAAISIMLTINYFRKVILLDSGQESKSLESVFRGIQRFYYVKEDSNYYIHRNGMDRILNDLHSTKERETLLQDSAVELIKEYLYYVPQSNVVNHLAYEYQLYHELSSIMDYYEKMSDVIMVRTKNGNNLNTKQVLEDADLVLVELVQNYNVLDEFFDNYTSIRHKAIYIFSQYKVNSISIYNIMNKYHIKKEQIIILTEHMPMKTACYSGNLISYLKVNNNCLKDSEHYRCIRELRRAARLIIEQGRSGLLEKIT